MHKGSSFRKSKKDFLISCYWFVIKEDGWERMLSDLRIILFFYSSRIFLIHVITYRKKLLPQRINLALLWSALTTWLLQNYYRSGRFYVKLNSAFGYLIIGSKF